MSKRYSPQKAFELIRGYALDGDEKMATRIFAESRISFPRYMAALADGRRARASQEQEASA